MMVEIDLAHQKPLSALQTVRSVYLGRREPTLQSPCSPGTQRAAKENTV